LVELLVVIGIIALLISILLPVLGSVRRQAAAVKCNAAMREIGNAFQMYAMENRGYYPPMRTTGSAYRITFNSVPAVDLNQSPQYWMFFLAKFVSKVKFGASASNSQDVAYAMRSVLWGCPSFVPINSTSAGLSVNGQSVIYTGYGFNGFPEYTSSYPALNAAAPYGVLGDSLSGALDTHAVATMNSTNNWKTLDFTGAGTGRKWYKQKDWSTPAERALIGDCRAYVLEAMAAANIGAIAGQADLTGAVFWVGGSSPTPGQTSMDFYRHGVYPKYAGSNQFSTTGGKIAYNVLFADGHCRTLITREEGFRAARMRWPG